MLSETALARRRKYVNASEAAAIMQVSDWDTSADIYHRKINNTEIPPNDAMTAGLYMEKGILDWAEQFTGKLRRNQRRVCKRYKWLAATLDGITADGCPVQAKLSGNYKAWGPDGSDMVPDAVRVQQHVEMLCVEAPEAWCALLLGGSQLRIYKLQFEPELADRIITSTRDFYHDHLLAKVPPQGTSKHVESAAGTQDACVDMPAEIMRRLAKADHQLKKARDAWDTARMEAITALGEANRGHHPELGRVSYLSQVRHGFDGQRLRLKYPEAAQACSTTTHSRVFRFSPANRKGTQ